SVSEYAVRRVVAVLFKSPGASQIAIVIAAEISKSVQFPVMRAARISAMQYVYYVFFAKYCSCCGGQWVQVYK
nr:hypothetical protein [Cellvibrionaceae bacterium]